MEILIRLFVWILNRTYRQQGAGTSLYGSNYGSNPMDEKVLIEIEESRRLEREAQRQNQIVESFKSTATPVQGAVEYGELNWDSYDSVVETPDQFVFCNSGSVQKVIAKSAFTSRQEIVTLRRVIRRRIRNCEQRDE